MTAFRVVIDGRAWEGVYDSFGNAVFGACRADENSVGNEASMAAQRIYPHTPDCKVPQGGQKSNGGFILHDWQCDCGAMDLRRGRIARSTNAYRAQITHEIKVTEIPTTKPKKIHRV